MAKIKEEMTGEEIIAFEKEVRQKNFEESLGGHSLQGMKNQEILERDEPVRIIKSNPLE